MAKVTGPLHSNSASGKIGPRMVFSERASGSQVRYQKAQKDRQTLPQLTNRGLYNIAVITWNNLSQAQKDSYIELAKYKGMSGYNYFLKNAIDNPLQYLGLCAYWAMNEISGATVYDKSGNNNNGTLSPTYPSDCPSRLDSSKKKLGKRLSFDGVNDYVNVPSSNSLNFGNGAFSIEIWFDSFTNTESFPALINKSDNGDFTSGGGTLPIGFILFYYPVSSLNFILHDGSTPYTGYNNIIFGDLRNKGLQHLVVTVDSSLASSPLIKGYLNGKLKVSSARTKFGSISNSFALNIGQWRRFPGNLKCNVDYCSLYNRALSSNEVADLFNSYL